MTQTSKPADGSQKLNIWLDRKFWQFSRHWLEWVNGFLAVFVSLPFITPILMKKGFDQTASWLYHAYGFTCHQLPSRSYFIKGQQVAICQRDVAIWLTIFLGGLGYALFRKRIGELPFYWWVLSLIPIGLDGGTQLIAPISQYLPRFVLTVLALIIAGSLSLMIHRKDWLRWQYLLFFACLPLGVLFVELTGPRLSNWQLRSMTGVLFGLACVWLIFPIVDEEFGRIEAKLNDRLHQSR